MSDDNQSDEMSGTWKFVADGNADALSFALKGDPGKAFEALDRVRDQALKLEPLNAQVQNEIECRRLETRLCVAGVSLDWVRFWQCMQDIGRSRRFDAERLHDVFETAAGQMRIMLEKGKP